jgi:hypothetical protein
VKREREEIIGEDRRRRIKELNRRDITERERRKEIVWLHLSLCFVL